LPFNHRCCNLPLIAGKSTALKILAGKLKPNLGRFDVSPLCLLWRLLCMLRCDTCCACLAARCA